MSGICGWFNPSDPMTEDVTATVAARMVSQLPRPSSPSIQQFTGGAVCSAGRACSVAVNPEHGLACAVVGRVHWADPQLKLQAAETTNAEALLTAFGKFGETFSEQIHGTFAVAVIDFRNGLSALAVDRMGIRPLCCAATDSGGVVFGSTATSVAANPAVSSSLSHQSLYSYFYFHIVPSPATIFEQIRKLEPAQIAFTGNGATRQAFYWQPRPDRDAFASRSDELLSELRARTRDAVARTSPDDHTACFLSGGLDSSTVSGFANEMTHEPIRAYTIGFDQQGFDETSFARVAAKHFALKHIEYYITPADVAEAFDLLSTAYDEPFGNSSAIPAYFCARKAHADGVERLLAGDGGDELFAGNERYAKQKLFEIYSKIPSLLRNFLLQPLVGHLRIDRPKVIRKARRYVEQARIPMPDRLQTYNYLEMYSPATIFQRDFLESVDVDLPRRDMRQWYERSADFDFLNRMLIFDWKLTLADNDIRKVNRMCEAAGVDVDYPLLDYDLVNFSLQIPPSLKLKGFDLRYAFKEAHRDFLPTKILEKEKHGFGLPFGEWLRTSVELREKIMPCIDRFRTRGILRDEFIDEMLDKHAADHASFYGEMLWLIAVAENWLASQTD